MTELNLTALDAAIKAGGMQSFDHIEDRMQDAIRAYLSALPAPSSDGLCERLEEIAAHYSGGNRRLALCEAIAALRSRDARIAELEADLEIARSVHRWTVDDAGYGLLHVCRRHHEKSDPCEWEAFVPLDQSEARIAELEELIRENWLGQYWRMMSHDDADRVNACLAARASLTKEQTDGE